ncbi:hypothetical protein ACFWG6_17520 [Streptomyces erythrochromogenes]|uniref:hypothetical protein n=1 Tax=Streptomyces erythrochromogenes TaxID=285574 RepID=UPI00363FF17A
MSGRRSATDLIESAWRELDAPDAGNRDGCLEVVADIPERGLLARADAERVAGRLVAVALSDEGYALREAALNALGVRVPLRGAGAAGRRRGPFRTPAPAPRSRDNTPRAVREGTV